MKGRRLLAGVLVLLLGGPLLLLLLAVLALKLLDQETGTIVSSGEQRQYLLHVPAGYDAAHPVPLVISLHGAGLWPALQMHISHWNRVADAQGFLVVYPSARGLPKIWNVARVAGLDADVRFISDLINTLQGSYNIDPARIYASGMSNGGGMAYVLSCTLSARIAAVGMVAAAQSLEWEWCTDPHPVPMIDFHGTADPVIPYLGGPSPVAPGAVFPSVPGWAQNWGRRNHCAADPHLSVAAPDVTRLEYGSCTGGAGVILYTVQGGGHSWPGGLPLPRIIVGPTSSSVDATAQMWTFFAAHPLAASVR